jgi:hypothetical protein
LPYVIGVVLALVAGLLAMWIGLDRDRAFYPTVMIVIALYYVLFAAIGGSGRVVLLESVVMAGFAAMAVVGLGRANGSSLRPWLVMASSMPCTAPSL